MIAIIFAISLVASFIFALGGVGAAIILVPVLVSLGIPIQVAKPVGLFYNTVSLAGASFHNIKNKRLDLKLTLPILIASFVFAVVGAYLSKFVPSTFILLLFTAFLIFSASMFAIHKKHPDSTYRTDVKTEALVFTGAVAGLLSGLLGIGGGGVISPLLLMMGINPKRIATVTAFVVPFSSFSGFLTYYLMGSVNWPIMLTASVGGLAGAVLGTIVMHKHLHPEVVKKVLASILFLMAVKLLFKLAGIYFS